ncbi:unnamed protein product [Adineta steineri]|uniref:Uncharacterized protein n=1 Tax=Adineta steineri TaxID=433720 RepID=A0A815JT74_9BILA|nr:unnamed protein product [Adineta steineri]
MATNGFFTYRDLYGGKPELYHQSRKSHFSSSDSIQYLSTSSTPIISLPTTTDLLNLFSSTTIQLDNKLSKFIQLIPFDYLYWFLIGLAILLTLILIIIFAYYFRSHCRRPKKATDEKRESVPSIYRYRKSGQGVSSHNIYETTSPFPFPSPVRPRLSQSVERRNNQLLREGLNAVGSPRGLRTDVNHAEPASSFSSTASDLLTEMKDRLNTHLPKAIPKQEQVYETQRANMALND